MLPIRTGALERPDVQSGHEGRSGPDEERIENVAKKLPKHLEILNACRKEEGVKPGQKVSGDQKKKIEACVLRKSK